ncbi:ATP-binding protein [Tianweitania sp. BSSL-BM11]|uniref:ATP-binding protein n=2 Tax=Tianweitania aestuarii TaxID=2814886 RepID=A0ABS5S1E0_9HYPH|nr:ATP-binding protein [Tianweitania aestuarii]
MPKSAASRVSKQSSKLAALTRKNSNGADLFRYIEPTHSASDIVLDADAYRILAEVAEEFKRGDDLRRFGLKPRSKLLFCGPPGCGKTLCAEVLATELHLPLVVARLDSIITTYLGETASNLRQLFEAAATTPTILFLDEFDALGRTRTDASEHSEIRRVVNSLLMLIEEFEGRGIVIAATNLERSIDTAIWRRFDEVVFFKSPTGRQILRLLQIKTRNFEVGIDFEKYLSDLEGMSFAEIERVCMSAIRREIMKRKSTLSDDTFSASLRDEKRRILIRDNIQR